jgi:hypothetical protein
MPFSVTARSTKPISPLRLFSISDIHISDKESPSAAIYLGFLDANGSAHSSVMLTTTRLLRGGGALHHAMSRTYVFAVLFGPARHFGHQSKKLRTLCLGQCVADRSGGIRSPDPRFAARCNRVPNDGIGSVLDPHGVLNLKRSDDAPALDDVRGARLQQAFAHGSGHGLLSLGADEVGTSLPPSLAYWREFAARYVAALCTLPGLGEDMRKPAVAVPASEELEAFAANANSTSSGTTTSILST